MFKNIGLSVTAVENSTKRLDISYTTFFFFFFFFLHGLGPLACAHPELINSEI
jgi:hypothetical protein